MERISGREAYRMAQEMIYMVNNGDELREIVYKVYDKVNYYLEEHELGFERAVFLVAGSLKMSIAEVNDFYFIGELVEANK